MKLKYLNNIGFFRIVFSLVIVYGHIIDHFLIPQFGRQLFFCNLIKPINFTYGYLCDAFFIISGFFMFFSYKKNSNFDSIVLTKIARLWPVLYFSLLCAFILSLFDLMHFRTFSNFIALFCLNVPIGISSNNLSAWYVDVLFWGYILYYSLFKLLDQRKSFYVTTLITFFCYSYLFTNLSSKLPCSHFMIRGIAGMGLGYLTAIFYISHENLINKKNNTQPLYSILELVALSLLTKTTITKGTDSAFLIVLICFYFLFLDFLFKKGILSYIFDSHIVSFLSKYCFSLFLMQDMVFPVTNKLLWTNADYGTTQYPILSILGGIFLCIITGIFTYYCVEQPFYRLLLKKCGKIHKK